jgi:hypothetical protein
VSVAAITVDPGRQVVVYVTGSADLSSLIQGILPFEGEYSVTGYVEVMVDRE